MPDTVHLGELTVLSGQSSSSGQPYNYLSDKEKKHVASILLGLVRTAPDSVRSYPDDDFKELKEACMQLGLIPDPHAVYVNPVTQTRSKAKKRPVDES